MDGDAALGDIPREEDPFWEPPEDILIGTANVFLQSLAYALDFDDKLSVTDYKVLKSFWLCLVGSWAFCMDSEKTFSQG